MRSPLRLALAALALPALALAEPCPTDGVFTVDGLGTPADELSRLADLAPGALAPESGMLRRGAVRERPRCAGGPEMPWGDRYLRWAPEGRALAAAPLRLTAGYRNLSPAAGNDGLLWQGRGGAALAAAGVLGRLGPVAWQLSPELAWSQNDHFRTPPGSLPDQPFSSPWYGDALDLPQRPGAGPTAAAALGQSFLGAALGGLEAGVSTENRWWGPGRRASLLLSDAAPGFPHAYLGTARPWDPGVGALELLAVWGRLSRSAGFPEGGHPALAGLAFAWSPRWVPGLHLGFGRVFVETPRSLRDDWYLSVLEPPVKGWVPGGDNPGDNQLLSLWWRWVMPPAGFELYGEWAVQDFSAPDRMVREPERTTAWTLGFQRLAIAGPRWIRVAFELTTTRSALPPGYDATFYTHPDDLGYTHRGQPLGAALGPGGAGFVAEVDVFGPGGRTGVALEWTRRNEDVFWDRIAGPPPSNEHDAELVGVLRQTLLLGPVVLDAELGGGFRWNRDFLRDEPVFRASLEASLP
ncbi:MAG: capsule assembly Wzi family protein [Anaeromyxobacteraceae bacterium]|nr:capsule assembly Wzi family protein [Anaeromyxobacteraceae bacterium]